MRLLIASDSFEPKVDGVAGTSGVLARSLAARGHQVTVVAPDPGDTFAGGAQVARIPALPLPMYPEVRLAYRMDRLSRAIRTADPEAAIIMTAGPLGMASMALLPRKTQAVHVYTADIPSYLRAYRAGFVTPVFDGLLRWMARQSVVTLCPTGFVRDDLAARGVMRLGIWGRGVDTALFHPDRRSIEMRVRLTDGEPDRPLVLYVGRLAREKRLLDLLEATRSLRHARFAFVGDGPQRADLERLFPADRTVFTGYLRGEPLAAAFASADAFAFPSDTDTFAQVVLQAMASGVPPVVVAGTAPAEFVADEVAGLHAPARSPGGFAAVLGRLLDDPTLQQRLSLAAFAAAQGHSWEALVDGIEALCCRATAAASPAPVAML